MIQVKNHMNNPVWIGRVMIMPGETAEVDFVPQNMTGIEVITTSEDREVVEHTFEITSTSTADYGALVNLSGVENELALELLDRFGSLEEVRKATTEELIKIPGIGEKRAKLIKEQLKSERKDEKVSPKE